MLLFHTRQQTWIRCLETVQQPNKTSLIQCENFFSNTASLGQYMTPKYFVRLGPTAVYYVNLVRNVLLGTVLCCHSKKAAYNLTSCIIQERITRIIKKPMLMRGPMRTTNASCIVSSNVG